MKEDLTLQEFLELADQYITGDLNNDERHEFETFCARNPLFAKKFDEHRNFLDRWRLHEDRADFKNKLEEVTDREVKKPIIHRIWTLVKMNVAAAAAVAIISSLATLYTTGYFATIKKTTSDYSALRREINNVKRNVSAQNTVIRNINSAHPDKNAIQYGATGFLLNKNGYVVTNYHVVNGADSIHLQDRLGSSYKASIIYKDLDKDLAILQIDDTSFNGYQTIPYSFKQQSLDLGEDIYTIGYPRDEAVYGEGYLSSSTGYAGDTLAYQISIPLNPGNSGGPVFDHHGNVIGIISGKQKGIDGAGFAIKTKALLEALHSIPLDSLTGDVELNTKNSISKLSRTEQIKRVQDFIYIVKVF